MLFLVYHTFKGISPIGNSLSDRDTAIDRQSPSTFAYREFSENGKPANDKAGSQTNFNTGNLFLFHYCYNAKLFKLLKYFETRNEKV